ncbi:MAG: hypothetical protein Ta2F_15130 [Termitinemataceae bacterium]|nr:MAG: hypothetical protein Ta2F_15130 [Termitinemataceae bacterium]
MIFNTLKEKFRGEGIAAPKVRASILLLALLVAAGSCKMELDGASSSEDTNSGGAVVVWTVTFEPQGGNFDGSEDAVSKQTNSKSRISVLPQPEKEGVTFAGWHIEDSIDSPQFTSATIVSKNMTVYAAWANEVKTVTFWTLNDEGELEEFSETRIAPPQTTVVLEESPLRAGYAFAGWYTITQPDILITNKEDAAAGTADVEYDRIIPTQNQFFMGHTVVVNGMQIYALWQERLEDAVMITFEAYPGNVVKNLFALGFHDWRIPDSSTIPATGTRPHYNPQDSGTWFLPDGSEFTKNSSEEDADGTQFLKEDGDIVLHANWTGKTYTVTFYKNDGTAAVVETKSVVYPETLDSAEIPTAAAVGAWDNASIPGLFTTAGNWYTTDDCTSGTEFTSDTTIEGNVSVYVQWTQTGRALIFDTDGGTTSTPATQYAVEADDWKITPTPVAKPKKEGSTNYVFAGWWYTPNGGAETEVTEATEIEVPAEGLTVSARWYSPTDGWTYNSGTGGMSKTVSYSTSAQTFSAPVNGSYTFELWGANGGSADLTSASTAHNKGDGGKGGYTKGTLSLTTTDSLYIFTGGKGGDCSGTTGASGGSNGGGKGGNYKSGENQSGGGGGGGGTDLRTSNTATAWDTRILVAGGGGGGIGATGTGNTGKSGGKGGGTSGEKGSASGINGGTQSTGNALGTGGNGTNGNDNGHVGRGGGGGGYYGGYGGGSANNSSGAGGSGYIGGIDGKTVTDGLTATSGATGFESSPVTTGQGHVRVTYTP